MYIISLLKSQFRTASRKGPSIVYKIIDPYKYFVDDSGWETFKRTI